MYRQGPRIGQSSKEVICGRVLCLPILQRILNEMSDLGSNDLEDAQVVAGESVGIGLIERQNSDQPVDAVEGHSQGRTERYNHFLIAWEANFDRGIPVNNGFAICRDPTAEACSDRYHE